jgi:soluble lytic murein transglycosylase
MHAPLQKAARQAGLIGGLVAICFALTSVAAPPEADATAPASVFATPELRLPRQSPESRAVAALAAGNPVEARKIAQEGLASAHEPSLGRLRWLLAKSTPDIGEARVHLQALIQSTHPLAQWARLRLTERLREHDPTAAAESAEVLLGQPLFRTRAEQLLALSLYGAGRTQEAEPLLRGLVAEAPERSSALAYSLPLATILAAKPDQASQKQALSLFRRIVTRAPASVAAEQARKQAAALLAGLPAVQRAALTELSADEAFAEADALADSRDYIHAAERYSAIAKRFRGDPKSVCDARLAQGKALFSAKKPNDALMLFEDVTQLCVGASYRADAHYQAGRVLLRRGEPAAAIAHYDSVANDFPNDRLADDALLAAASAFQDLGDLGSARQRLQRLLSMKTQGDLRADARFMLAWLERSDHHYDAALTEFTQLLSDGPEERSEDIVGRVEYWRARTLLDLGNSEAAEDALIALINRHPLTYYAQQALARLEEFDKPTARKLSDDLRDPDSRNDLRLAPRPEQQKPEFLRAIELLYVGEPPAAVEELDALGCFRPDAPNELYMLAVSLLQEFGADSPATQIARRRVGKVMSEPPKGPSLALWRVVFPRAYRPLIDDIAHKADLPPAFVRAIAREESSFDANAVSPANAYGLIQLIRPTARTYARPLGLPSDPDSLKKPEINLRIGTAFMRYLWDRYRANPAVIPSAYNAGPGATDRWLRERGKLPLDEWVESIPYTETRRYTRRVLQSYGVYAWLDEGRLPQLPKKLPQM